jgi:radical SAM-linked protein
MVYKTLHISYARRGPAQYFGHLELVNIFLRAIRRACIPVKYSEGFHPMPKVSFHDPLPIGMESQGESFYITVADSVKPGEIPHRLNPYLPEGIQVLDCQIALSRSARKKPDAENFEITLKTGEFDQDRIQAFRQMSERILTRVRPNGKVRKIDLKKAILDMELLAPNRLRMTLSNADGQMIRPAEAVREIFGMDSDPIRQAQILKL